MLERDPSKRPNMDQILEHPSLRQTYRKIIKKWFPDKYKAKLSEIEEFDNNDNVFKLYTRPISIKREISQNRRSKANGNLKKKTKAMPLKKDECRFDTNDLLVAKPMFLNSKATAKSSNKRTKIKTNKSRLQNSDILFEKLNQLWKRYEPKKASKPKSRIKFSGMIKKESKKPLEESKIIKNTNFKIREQFSNNQYFKKVSIERVKSPVNNGKRFNRNLSHDQISTSPTNLSNVLKIKQNPKFDNVKVKSFIFPTKKSKKIMNLKRNSESKSSINQIKFSETSQQNNGWNVFMSNPSNPVKNFYKQKNRDKVVKNSRQNLNNISDLIPAQPTQSEKKLTRNYSVKIITRKRKNPKAFWKKKFKNLSTENNINDNNTLSSRNVIFENYQPFRNNSKKKSRNKSSVLMMKKNLSNLSVTYNVSDLNPNLKVVRTESEQCQDSSKQLYHGVKNESDISPKSTRDHNSIDYSKFKKKIYNHQKRNKSALSNNFLPPKTKMIKNSVESLNQEIQNAKFDKANLNFESLKNRMTSTYNPVKSNLLFSKNIRTSSPIIDINRNRNLERSISRNKINLSKFLRHENSNQKIKVINKNGINNIPKIKPLMIGRSKSSYLLTNKDFDSRKRFYANIDKNRDDLRRRRSQKKTSLFDDYNKQMNRRPSRIALKTYYMINKETDNNY